MAKLRIVLAEDHVVIREGLKRLINDQSDMEVVGEAGDGVIAWQRTQQLNPDIVLMDITLPGLNGADATIRIKKECPDVKVIALTAHRASAYLKQVMKAGASGYVLKKVAFDELMEAIRTVASGGEYIDLASRKLIHDSTNEMPRVRHPWEGKDLTEREIQVLSLVANGYTNKDIANQLAISVKTVESHKANCMEKMDLRSRAEVVDYARLQGWI